MTDHPLGERLRTLLPGTDAAWRATVAQKLTEHVRLQVLQSWHGLVQQVAGCLAPSSAAALRAAAWRVPEPDLLLARLDGVIDPGALLSLPIAEHGRLTRALLANPEPQLRERTLDALQAAASGGAAPGGAALRAACSAWSRRMLMAELGRIPALNHVDRLRLQEELAVPAADTIPDSPPGLTAALQAAAHRSATAILAARAGVALDVAEAAIGLRDRKMLLSLCWKADCDAAETVAVQVQLGRVAPDQVLRRGSDESWPLAEAAMQWQIGILQDV